MFLFDHIPEYLDSIPHQILILPVTKYYLNINITYKILTLLDMSQFSPDLNIWYQYLISKLTLLSYVRMWRTWLHLGRIGLKRGERGEGDQIERNYFTYAANIKITQIYRATSSPLFRPFSFPLQKKIISNVWSYDS